MRSSPLLLLVMLAGCALAPKASENPYTAPLQLSADPDFVRELLPKVYDAAGLGPGFFDPSTDSYASVRVIPVAAPWIGDAEEPLLRCASSPTINPLVALAARFILRTPANVGLGSAPAARVSVSVSTVVEDDGEGSELFTVIRASDSRARFSPRDAAPPHCVSTGLLERRIGELVAEEVERRLPA